MLFLKVIYSIAFISLNRRYCETLLLLCISLHMCFCPEISCDAYLRRFLFSRWVKLEAKHASSRRAVALPPPPSLTTTAAGDSAVSGTVGTALNVNGLLPMEEKFTLEGDGSAFTATAEYLSSQRLADEEEAAGLRRAAQLAREGLERFPAEFSLHQTLGTVIDFENIGNVVAKEKNEAAK